MCCSFGCCEDTTTIVPKTTTNTINSSTIKPVIPVINSIKQELKSINKYYYFFLSLLSLPFGFLVYCLYKYINNRYIKTSASMTTNFELITIN